MTTKRPYDDYDQTSSSKKPRRNDSRSSMQDKSRNEPQTDLTYGQRTCFPGLDGTGIEDDDDLEFEDAADALAYLQSVRLEASAIPHVVTAPKAGPQLPTPGSLESLDYDDSPAIDRGIYENGVGDARGWYADGAYTAAPDVETHESLAQDEDSASRQAVAARLREAYFTSLSTSFLNLRHQLAQPPPLTPPSSARITPPEAYYVAPLGPKSKTFSVWTAYLRDHDPHPHQIAQMDKYSVFRLLRVILGGKLLKPGAELQLRTSCWIWSLLGKLPERGEVDHVEAGSIREIGKRAALMMHSLNESLKLARDVEAEVLETQEADGEDWAADVGMEEDVIEEVDLSDVDSDLMDVENPDVDATAEATHSGALPVAPLVDTEDELEDGEVPDDPLPLTTEEELTAARNKLLAQLEDIDSDQAPSEHGVSAEDAANEARARSNTRATLNMILTVVGELYGQRDLLEFRSLFQDTWVYRVYRWVDTVGCISFT